jgi:hypothetical protein
MERRHTVSSRSLILAIIAVLVIAGGAVAAVLLLTGDDDTNKHNTANPGGSVPPRSVAAVSCTAIKDAMIQSGAVGKGSITITEGGSQPVSGLPRPPGSPTTACTVRPTDPNDVNGTVDHITVIAWHGVTEDEFGGQLKHSGYHPTSEGEFTVYTKSNTNEVTAAVVTATIANQLVTFYSS